MPPSKASRAGHDDSKTETPASKDKSGHGHGHGNTTHQPNGKLRRVASSTGSNLRDVTNAASLPSPAVAEGAAGNAQPSNPSLQWSSFDRSFLHRYRRTYNLNTPTAYSSDYHSWVLTQRGSIGLYSPTLSRKREFRRQSKDQLANSVRKHFNSQGVQENDVIVDFIHRVRRGGVAKLKSRRTEHVTTEAEKP